MVVGSNLYDTLLKFDPALFLVLVLKLFFFQGRMLAFGEMIENFFSFLET